MKPALIYLSLSSLIGAGGFLAFTPKNQPVVSSYYSQSGRDAALIALLHSAKKSIYVRTELMDCAPIANVLLQCQQNGVPVHVELPARGNVNTEIIINTLAKCGGTFELTSQAASSYEGCYVLVDGQEWLYSAAPLNYGQPGVPRSFVRGRKG